MRKALIKFKQQRPSLCSNVYFNINKYNKLQNCVYNTVIIADNEYTCLIIIKTLYCGLNEFLENLIKKYDGSNFILINILSFGELNLYSYHIKFSVLTL